MSILMMADTVTLTPDEVERIVKEAIAKHLDVQPDQIRFRFLTNHFRDGSVLSGWPEIYGVFE